MSTAPSLTIAIPTLDEAANIRALVERFLATRYPALDEILVADGGSTDGTREIVRELAARDARVVLVENPGRIQAAGLNLALERARGEIFLRADAHCLYADDYVERCVETLLETGAQNVGGAQRFVARATFQAGVALAARSPLGTGGAGYRDPERDGWVETVFLGCFWRDTLREVGGYSLRATNEDSELNIRLLAKAPPAAAGEPARAVYVSSRIRVEYFPRSTPRALARQYFRYGLGRCRTVLEHPGRSPWRSQIPFLAISAAVAIGLVDLFLLGGALRTPFVAGVGGLAILAEGARATARTRARFLKEIWRGDPARAPGLAARALCASVAILCQPLAHSAGFATELARRALGRTDAS